MIVEPDELIRLLGAVFGSAVLTTVLQGWFGRKRMSADAVNLIQQAAGGITKVTAEDNVRLRTENSEVRHLNDVLVHTVRQQTAYSARQSDEIRRLGGHLEDPPPLPDEVVNY